MKSKNTITPLISSRIVELAASGKTDSEIARALGGKVTRQGIRKHRLKRQPSLATKSTVAPPRTATASPATKAQGATISHASTISAAANIPPDVARALEPLPDLAGLVDIVSRLEMTRTLLDEMAPKLITGEVNASLWVQLGRFEADLAEKVMALTPTPPPDPEHDPVNATAAARVRAKLEVAIKSAEKDFRCASCGKSPYPKVG